VGEVKLMRRRIQRLKEVRHVVTLPGLSPSPAPTWLHARPDHTVTRPPPKTPDSG
jgi:hypothetical protein